MLLVIGTIIIIIITIARFYLILQYTCSPQQLLDTLTLFYLDPCIYYLTLLLLCMNVLFELFIDLLFILFLLFHLLILWMLENSFSHQYSIRHFLFASLVFYIIIIYLFLLFTIWFVLILLFDVFLFSLLPRMIDWCLNETIPNLFALPLIQLTHPINLLNQLLILINMTGCILKLILLLTFISKHGKL